MKDGNSVPTTFDELIDISKLPDDERREKLRILFDALYGSDTWRERFDKLGTEALAHKDFILDVLSAAQQIQGMTEDEARERLQPLWDELHSDTPADMTLIPRDDRFQYAISKAVQRQREIASQGAEGQAIFVDRNGTTIQATITTTAGKPLSLSAFDKQIQDVCGDIVRRAGKGAKVSANQIYREFAKMSADEDITAQQEQEVIDSMERQAETMVDLDFIEQIKRHTGLKQQADFDYSGAKANIRYALIPCKRQIVTARDGSTHVGFVLYDFPALYYYSHVVDQIATAPARLLTTFGKAYDTPKKKAPKKPNRSTQQTELRRYLLDRIGNMLRDYKAHRKPKKQIILLSEVFADFNEPQTEKTQRTLRKNIELILDAWIETPAETNISSWDYHKKPGTRGIIGYELTLYTPIKKKSSETKS